MRGIESGLIWVLLATVTVMASFALIRSAQTQKHQNDALHTIICTIQAKELHPSSPDAPKPTAAQKAEIIKFWSEELKAANLVPCTAPPPPPVTTTTT